MAETVIRCPACGAPLVPPSRFARTMVCAFCAAVVTLDPSVVKVARFREARADWDGLSLPRSSIVGGKAWSLGALLGRGDVSDVFDGERLHGATGGARPAGERAVVKVLRSESDLPVFDREWATLSAIVNSAAPGAPAFSRRVPEPVTRGVIEAGPLAGRHVLIVRATPTFRFTLQQIRRDGAPDMARASLWVWRRVLEILTFLHRAGLVHGAILPPHVLVQDDDHGARLVGFGNAGGPGSPRLTTSLDFATCYPSGEPSAASDVIMSARTLLWLLGDAQGPPAGLPAPYARTLADASRGAFSDAWALREHLGTIARQAFGAPAFCPLVSAR